MSDRALYGNKPDRYYSRIRWDLIDLIPAGGHQVLEVGCGNGATLKKARELGKSGKIYGIEINESMRPCLGSLDGVYIGDVESAAAPFPGESFDYILFGDVLEHLADPWQVLSRYRRLLKKDGRIIASIPNVKFIGVMWRLVLADEFRYRESGVLDRTHLRFFTRTEIRNLFRDSRLAIVTLEPNLDRALYDKLQYRLNGRDGRGYPEHPLLRALGRAINRLPGSSFFTLQYLVVARDGG